MMNNSADRDYYERRLREEQTRQAASPDEATARIHAKLAEAYAQKLEASGNGAEAAD